MPRQPWAARRATQEQFPASEEKRASGMSVLSGTIVSAEGRVVYPYLLRLQAG